MCQEDVLASKDGAFSNCHKKRAAETEPDPPREQMGILSREQGSGKLISEQTCRGFYAGVLHHFLIFTPELFV